MQNTFKRHRFLIIKVYVIETISCIDDAPIIGLKITSKNSFGCCILLLKWNNPTLFQPLGCAFLYFEILTNGLAQKTYVFL